MNLPKPLPFTHSHFSEDTLSPLNKNNFRLWGLPILASALLLGGCSTLAPDYQRPNTPVPDQFERTVSTDLKATKTLQLPSWQQYFKDQILAELIENALNNNRDMRIAAHRLSAAKAVYGIQRSEKYPSIGLGGNASRSRSPADISISQTSMITNNFQISANLSTWEMDFWGRIRSLETAALQDYFSMESSRQALQVSLIGQISNSYLLLRALEQQIALAGKSVTTRQESYRIFKRRFETGVISELELTQVETLLKQAQSLQIQLQQQRESTLYDLQYLIGGGIDIVENNNYFDDSLTHAEIYSNQSSNVLLQRPDIMAAEHKLRSATANIGAARAAFFPTIRLTGYAGAASGELSGLFDSGSESWSFAPQLYLPIFNAGRNQANLDLSIAQQNQALATYEQTIQNAFREVSSTLANQHWLKKQLQLTEETLAIIQKRASLADLRYKSGTTTYLEVLDAQRDLLSIEQSVVEAKRALASSQIALYTTLGGGSINKISELPQTP
jgi:multidrug efflux system outer membrane protein